MGSSSRLSKKFLSNQSYPPWCIENVSQCTLDRKFSFSLGQSSYDEKSIMLSHNQSAVNVQRPRIFIFAATGFERRKRARVITKSTLTRSRGAGFMKLT